ncbi:hypothetical protein KVH22_32120 [Streptomyces olivaceus]|nr:hypothetical protein [Streptomyces olivaceus]
MRPHNDSGGTAGPSNGPWPGSPAAAELHRHYGRKAEHFLAFTSLACPLICYRRLAK